MLIDAGLFNFNYDAGTERLTLAPSTVRWGGSSVSVAGVVLHEANDANWAFDIRSVSGSLAAEEFKVAPVKLDNFAVSGRYVPDTNRIEFANVSVEVGGGSMVLAGDVVAGDGATAGARIDGRFGPADANVVKALWPRMMAPRARQWFGDHLTSGVLRAGTIRFASGAFAPPEAHKGRKGLPESFSLDLTGESVTLQPVRGGPPLSSAAVAVTVRDQALEITMPDATLTTGPQAGVSLKEGRSQRRGHRCADR